MVVVEVEREIEGDCKQVFDFIANFENNPKWQKGMVSAKFTSELPIKVGTTYDQIAKFLGKEVITSFRVLEYKADKLVKATSTSGSFPITFTRWVEPTNQHCVVKALIEGKPGGFFRIFGPVLKILVRRNINRDYDQLKAYFEDRNVIFHVD